MKKFGFGKKSDGDDASVKSGSSGRFGRKKDSSQDDNPYAQTSSPDPYAAPMTPYQQARAGLPSGPRVGAPNGLPSGPGPRGSNGPPPPYSSTGSSGSGYGAEKFGAAGGYGSNRYDDNASAYSANSSIGSRGPGGYGGLGRTDTMDGDDNRGALFGGAKDRYQPPRQGQPQNADAYGQRSGAVAGPSSLGGGYGDDSNKAQLLDGAKDRYAQQPRRDYGHASSSNDESYDGYGAPRELTEEEREQQELQDIKQEIRDVRDASKATTSRTLQIMYAAEEQARGTYARLGGQGDRLHNTDANLNLAANYNKVAEDRTKELKTLNRSMFAVHVSNPFTAKDRKAARDAEVIDRHRMEREQREATRRDAYRSNQRMEDNFKSFDKPKQLGSDSSAAAERSRFVFIDDDDPNGDDELTEKNIDTDIKEMTRVAGSLNGLARAINEEVEQQNKLIDRIAMKSDAVDDGVRMNREKLNRIR